MYRVSAVAVDMWDFVGCELKNMTGSLTIQDRVHLINIRSDNQGNPLCNEGVDFVHRLRVSDLSEQKTFTCMGKANLFTAWRHISVKRNGVKFASDIIEQ
jgi:hypothetical protein